MAQSILIDLAPLTRSQQAVYRLWMQRAGKLIQRREGPLSFFEDGIPILVAVAMRFAERIGIDEEEGCAIAYRVLDFELAAHRLLCAPKGLPS